MTDPAPGATARRAQNGAHAKAAARSTAKVPQRAATERSTAKVPQKAAAFAVLDDIDDETDFDEFAGLDSKEWRIECRYRRRKDGQEIMYWNYRRRHISYDADGNRRIEYRKGGSRIR